MHSNTTALVSSVVQSLRDQGMRGLILDLRFNRGGLLTTSIELADVFIEDALIATVREPRTGIESKRTGVKEGSQTGFPMVCLVNDSTASGAEIVAACLQDQNRAVLIGERTYGKGSVQNVDAFDGGEIQITTSLVFRGTGKNLEKETTGGNDEEDWGVVPDKVLNLTDRERGDLDEHLRDLEIMPRRDGPTKPKKPAFQDRQLEMALEHLRTTLR